MKTEQPFIKPETTVTELSLRGVILAVLLTIVLAMSNAYLALKIGNENVQQGIITGYNIGINMGQSAGQTCMYPHVHLIPRKDGDTEDPVGGVRNVIPGKGNYKK